MDSRHPNQIINMRKSGFLDIFIFIFVGNIYDVFKDRKFTVPAYYGAVASLQTKYGCSINVVPDDFHAVLLSFYIFKHSDLTPRTSPILSVKVNKQQRQMAFLSCIRGVTVKSAEKVLIEYTIPQLCLIEDPDVLIEKIGIKRAVANSIVRFFQNDE
jgi:ERCC4-type nuclease